MKTKKIVVSLLLIVLTITLSTLMVTAQEQNSGLQSSGVSVVPTEGEDAATGAALEIAKNFTDANVSKEGNIVKVSGKINKRINPWDLSDTTSSIVGYWYGIRVLFPDNMVGDGTEKYNIYYGSTARKASQTYQQGATAVRLALSLEDVKNDGLEPDGTMKIQFDWNNDEIIDEVLYIDTTGIDALKASGVTTVPTKGEDAATGAALEIAKNFTNAKVEVNGRIINVSGIINKKINPWDLSDTTSSTVGYWYGIRVLFPKNIIGDGTEKYTIYYGSTERKASQTYQDGATAVRLALTKNDVKKDGIETDGTFKIQFDWNNDEIIDEIFYIDTTGIVLKDKTFITSDNESVIFESKQELPGNYKLHAEEKQLGELKENILSTSKDLISKIIDSTKYSIDKMEIITTQDITIKNPTDSTTIPIEGEELYKIYIKIDKEQLDKYTDFNVSYINDQNQVEQIFEAKVEDGYITFETNHLSTYSVIGYNMVKINNPETSDSIIYYIILATISFGSLIAITINAIRNKKKA